MFFRINLRDPRDVSERTEMSRTQGDVEIKPAFLVSYRPLAASQAHRAGASHPCRLPQLQR